MKLDDEGYEVIQPIVRRKGAKCGVCGMKFEDGKVYGYSCPTSNCPIFIKIR